MFNTSYYKANGLSFDSPEEDLEFSQLQWFLNVYCTSPSRIKQQTL